MTAPSHLSNELAALMQQRPDLLNSPDGNSAIHLCLTCYERFQAISHRETARMQNEINAIVCQMEQKSGCDLSGFKYRVPQPVNKVTMNNHLDLKGATVGVVNTGTIQKLTGAISVTSHGETKGLSDAAFRFSAAVIASNELGVAQQTEMLQLLTLLVENSSQPKESVSTLIVKTAIERITTLAAGVTALNVLYQETVKPLLEGIYAFCF